VSGALDHAKQERAVHRPHYVLEVLANRLFVAQIVMLLQQAVEQ